MSTLRERLKDESPLVPLKAAWRSHIRAARAARRARDADLWLSSRRAVEQALSHEVEAEADIAGLKDALRRLLAAEGADRHQVAVEIDERVRAMVATIAETSVPVVVSGWPEWLTLGDQARILGHPVQALDSLSPADAAQLVRELDGLSLGGARILVQVGLEAGERLPAVPRGQRARPRARGTRPWLPFLDDEGRYSLTPEVLAQEHAELLGSHQTVIDPFCGCGGDAIAFAEAGLKVIAVERDEGRLELAQQNAEARGVAQAIHFVHGRAEDHLPTLAQQHREAAIYLDPPWGGLDWNRAIQSWDKLVPGSLLPTLQGATQVLLKAPRALEPSSLPDLGSRWRIRPAWNPHPASPAERVLFLRALARPD